MCAVTTAQLLPLVAKQGRAAALPQTHSLQASLKLTPECPPPAVDKEPMQANNDGDGATPSLSVGSALGPVLKVY